MCFRSKESGRHAKPKPPKRVKVMLRDEAKTKAQKKYRKKLEKQRRRALDAVNRENERKEARRLLAKKQQRNG